MGYNVMKYDNVKEKVARGAYGSVMHGKNNFDILVDLIHMKPIPPRQAIQECADLAYETIMAWDIRCVSKLRELFPEYFPSSLKKGNLICDMDEKGNWCVVKAG